MHLVSILIPAYNDEEYIGDSIESALGQTYPECEVIVVDDGSTDDTVSKVRTYDNVRLITQANRGAPAARNRALEAAGGTYIQFLDADDLLHPGKVEAQVKRLDDSPRGTVAVSPTCYFQDGQDPKQGRLSRGSESLNLDDPVQWLINLWMPERGWGMVQTGAWLTPRSVIEDAGPWAEYVNPDDDGEFFTRVLLQSTGVQYVDEGCVYYRQHCGERVSELVSKEAFRGRLRSIDTRRDHLLPKTTDENREDAVFAVARSYWKLAVRALPMYSQIFEKASHRARELGMRSPPESVLPGTRKSRIVRRVCGWRVARYLQHWYRRLTSDAV
ncbi:glycosyltransferase involved in cell wall biosynthesis [Salinibacter ruber]|uniref:glycosyltransferase family 2 protein n=1 Tax=Salinibacter ruber TaxID=146919 RepID=UPI00244FD966|nr:glycosyltransferase involved in cell wall biosynthesis [Salinibacter ruber]